MNKQENLIYTQTDWEQGQITGSAYQSENNRLINQFVKLNEDNFNDPVYSSWEEDILLEEFVEYDKHQEGLRLNVKKLDDNSYIEEDYFGKVSTYLLKDDVPTNDITNLSVNFNLYSYNVSQTEHTILKIKNEDSYQEVVFSNQGQIHLKTFDSNNEYIDHITDTAAESIASITNFITNEISDGWIDFRINNGKLFTRARSGGYLSQWYERDFNGTINQLEIIQPVNKQNNSIVNKEFIVNDILVDGYNNQISYETEVFDINEEDSLLTDIELVLSNNDKIYQTPDINNISVELYYANQIDNLKNNSIQFDYSLNDNETTTVSEELNSINCRYYKLEITLTSNKSYQNSVEYILFKYITHSQLSDDKKQVTKHEVVFTLDSTDKVVNANADDFNYKLYIDNNTVDMPINDITIKRFPEGEEFGHGIIGFSFDKSESLNKPILLEVDYTGYDFGPYMSEKGMLLGYIDNNADPQSYNTIISTQNNKVLAYIYNL